MVLESLISSEKAESNPKKLFFIGIIYTTISLFLSYWVFKKYAGIIMISFIAIASVPLIYSIIKMEEQKTKKIKKERFLIKEHGKALSSFIFLFLGFVAAFTILYVFLPQNLVQQIFQVQASTIQEIRSITGSFINQDTFFIILLNNLKVLTLCIILSFFYGAGAIFILTWNASVISAAIGTFIRKNLSSVFGISYFSIFSIGVLRYLTHGIFEILAYFTAGLAGGIISVAVINHDFRTKNFREILIDSIDLIILSIIILIVAALIEVYITPVLF